MEQGRAFPGIFENLSTSKPIRNFIAFELNAPVCRPGVKLRSWMQIPKGKHIHFSEDDDWVFPEGSILVQHFETEKGNPFVLVAK